MATEIVTHRRSSETPPETLVIVLGRHGSHESAEPPAIAAHTPEPRVRVVADHTARPDPDWLGTV
jgi:hypothetical protein